MKSYTQVACAMVRQAHHPELCRWTAILIFFSAFTQCWILDTGYSSRIDPPTACFDRNPALLGRESRMPFDGKNLDCCRQTSFKGRIAFSSDGNYNDEDDWGAFPVAVAMLDAFGLTGKLVHIDYNNILAKNDPRFYREMSQSVLGAADRYNVPLSILFDRQKDLNGAINSIKNAINASSADNPLYYVLAGPMEVPFRGIEKSDPDKRK